MPSRLIEAKGCAWSRLRLIVCQHSLNRPLYLVLIGNLETIHTNNGQQGFSGTFISLIPKNRAWLLNYRSHSLVEPKYENLVRERPPTKVWFDVLNSESVRWRQKILILVYKF
jgi:hypothetical protein